MSDLLAKFAEDLARGRSFEETDAEPFLDAMIESEDEAILSALFHAWHRKGIEEHEIFFLAKIMRERSIKVGSRHRNIVDIVGTGGSKVKTFNVSTAAAFVVAGEGVPVAKHGNKAATSNTGSSDVLQELGIDHSVSPLVSERYLNELGICFMFAPNHHRLSPTLAKVRRRLGFPTIFNCIGPLCNPANAQHQLIGVWDRSLVSKMASALSRLGTKRSWVVHANDGLDEISVSDSTLAAEINGDKVSTFEIRPEDLGSERFLMNGSKAATAKESAYIVRRVLVGEHADPAAVAVTLINAAAAIYLAGNADRDLRDARDRAVESIRSGRAYDKLTALAKAELI